MYNLPKAVILDLTHNSLMEYIKALMSDRELSATEMELVLNRAILDIKQEKEKDYSACIFNLTAELQKRELNEKGEQDAESLPEDKLGE